MAIFTAALGITAATTTIAGLTVSLGGAALTAGTLALGYGINRAVKASDAARQQAALQRQAAEKQVRMQQQQVSRQRRQAVRRSILARAQLRQRAQAAGVQGSSAVAGGIGSISSQLGTNLGFSSMMSGLGREFTSLTGQANYFGSKAKMFQTQSNMGFGVAKQAFSFGMGQIPTGGDIFGSMPTSEPLPYTMEDGLGVG